MVASAAPNPSRLAIVLPLVLLWVLASEACEWLWRRLTFKGSGFIKVPAFLVIAFSLPIAINADVIAETLWKMRFSAAFGAYSNPELSLGFWRILLAMSALSFLLSGSWDADERFRVRDGLFALGLLLGECLLLAFIGELASFPIKPTGDPQNVVDSIWTAGRYMALSSAYTFASIAGLFSALMQPYMAETLTWGMLGAFAGAAAYLFVASAVASCVGDRAAAAALKLERKVEMCLRKPPEALSGGLRGPTAVFREGDLICAAVNVVAPSGDRVLWLKLPVDTCASHTKIHAKKLKDVDVKPQGKVKEKLADGRVVERECGFARIECKGKAATVPVIFGKKDDVEVLGMSAVEGVGLLDEIFGFDKDGAVKPILHLSTEADPVLPYEARREADPSTAWRRIHEAGFVAVYLGVDKWTGGHLLYPIPREDAAALLRGEAVNPSSESGRYVFEELYRMGCLEATEQGYMLKNADFEKNLRDQLFSLHGLL